MSVPQPLLLLPPLLAALLLPVEPLVAVEVELAGELLALEASLALLLELAAVLVEPVLAELLCDVLGPELQPSAARAEAKATAAILLAHAPLL